jgi:hypothetical protein
MREKRSEAPMTLTLQRSLALTTAWFRRHLATFQQSGDVAVDDV